MGDGRVRALLVALPVLVAVIVSAVLLLRDGNDVPSMAALPSFYTELRTESMGGPEPDAEPSVMYVRTWHDQGRLRLEYQQGENAADAVISVVVIDGERFHAYDPPGHTYFSVPLPHGSHGRVALPFTGAGSRSVTEYLDRLGGLTRTGGWSLEGEDVIHGRRVELYERNVTYEDFGLEMRQRYWVDPERMMVLRQELERDVLEIVSETVELRWDEPIDPDVFLFEPPAGATRIAGPTGIMAWSYSLWLDGHGQLLGGPESFLRPAFLPEGLYVDEQILEPSLDQATRVVWRFSEVEGRDRAPVLVIEQRAGEGLRPEETAGREVRIDGVTAYRLQTDDEERLAWQRDGNAIVISSTALDFAELRRIAESMQ